MGFDIGARLGFNLGPQGYATCPVEMGAAPRSGPVSFAAQGTATDAGHLGQGTGLIDEDQAARVEIRLRVEPGPAPLGDVGPLLLGCVRGFF